MSNSRPSRTIGYLTQESQRRDENARRNVHASDVPYKPYERRYLGDDGIRGVAGLLVNVRPKA